MKRALVVALAACGRIGFAPTSPTADAGTDGTIAPHGVWRSVVVGLEGTCAITLDGALWCWGDNYNGQIGIGDPANIYPAPTQIGTAAWKTVALGDEVTCGIQTDQTLWCWGSSSFGELGFGALYSRIDTPQQVDSSSWQAIAMGDHFACGLHTDATLWCWGRNNAGQLGNNSLTDVNRPTRSGLGQFTAIAAGGTTACAIDQQQHAECWGANDNHQVGDNTNVDRPSPTAVAGNHTWSAIAVGRYHACALELDGKPWCWGNNAFGKLGTGDTTDAHTPIAVLGPALATIDLAESNSCGADASGGGWCWGANMHGQLGTANDSDTPMPLRIADALAISTRGDHTCYVDPVHDLWCAGLDNFGETGQPATEVHSLTQADTRTDWKSIAAHADNVCGTTSDGHAWCWGANYSGQIGDGTGRDRQKPVDIGTGLSELSVGTNSTMAIGTTSGHAYGWGNAFGMLIPTDQGTAASAATVGNGHRCLSAPTNVVTCSGANSIGQLGIGTYDISDSGTIGQWSVIHATEDSTCGISGNTVQCWGDNVRKQLGLGAAAPPMTNVPMLVLTAANATDVQLAYESGCAIAGGTIFCWGANTYGEIGDGSGNAAPSPVKVGTRADWTKVGVGDFHVCAIAADHTLWCWGHADEGQLGLPLANKRTVPTQIGTDTDWVEVAGGEHFTCALKSTGTRWCMGYNRSGEQGDGRAWTSSFTRLP